MGPDPAAAARDAVRQARRSCPRPSLALAFGSNLLDQTKVLTAVSELTRNMLQYAGGGELWLALLRGSVRGIEVSAVDRGPGIADIDLVMSASYRSRTGLGMGLKGVKRIMDDLDIRSGPHLGTRVTIRKYLIEAT